jgi:asparagine N-glycosylation enzyme membrane subunit Stt3
MDEETFNFQEKVKNNQIYALIILLIPAIVTFLITLLPTLYNQWPLSWDIFRHVHLAKVYSQYGLVFIDPLINMPAGEKITYPPLFQLIIALIGTILKIDYFQIVRFLQPVLAMLFVFTVSYVTKKLYGLIAGVTAGFLILSSAMYARLVLALPENLALILLPIAIYVYYKSIVEKKYLYALISGIIIVLMFSVHRLAPFSPIMIITLFSIAVLIMEKELRPVYNYIVWLFTVVLITVGLFILALILKPDLIAFLFGKGTTIIFSLISYLNYDYTQVLPLWDYKTFLGYMATFFGVIGLILAFVRREKKDILLIIWILSMFFFSVAYIFGINVISFRLLLYILIPLSILGGVGIKFIYDRLSQQKIILPKILPALFLILVMGLSIFYGYSIATNPKTATFGAKTEFGTVQTAPPSQSDLELAQWFQKNGNKKKMIASANFYTAMFLLSTTDQPLYKQNIVLTGNKSRDYLIKKNITYLIYDKRLQFSANNKTSYILKDDGQLLYYNTNLGSKPIIPNFAKIVFENKDYIVCIVN